VDVVVEDVVVEDVVVADAAVADPVDVDVVVERKERRREGVGPSHQVGPSGQGWKDQVPGRDLPFLFAHQGVRDH
jgi:hypothetical protein